MLRILLGFAIMANLMTSCTQTDLVDPETNNCSERGNCSYTLKRWASLRWHEVNGKITGLETASGENLLFHYQYELTDNAALEGGEYKEEIWIEVPESGSSFLYEETALEDINVFFRKSCDCPGTDWVSVNYGRIAGEISDDGDWKLSIEIQFNLFGVGEVRTIEGYFK